MELRLNAPAQPDAKANQGSFAEPDGESDIPISEARLLKERSTAELRWRLEDGYKSYCARTGRIQMERRLWI
jgi:hypothetical protein